MDDQKFYMSFITILCDYKRANMLPKRDESEMNKKRGGLLKHRKRREKVKKEETKRVRFTLF